MKNKRGDIPITILVLGVVTICGLAIFSFYLANRNVQRGFESLYLIDEGVIVKEKIYLYESLGFTEDKTFEMLGIGERVIVLKDEKLLVKYRV